MPRTFRPYAPDQLLILPPSLRDWLPEAHPAYLVDDLVDALDLDPLYARYADDGHPPYDPRFMTKLLLYGYARGIFSSRKLERCCEEDVAFRVLCAGNQPDASTIAAFRRRHLTVLTALFSEALRICAALGVERLGRIPVRGAARRRARAAGSGGAGRAQREQKRLKAEIEALLARSLLEDAKEDERWGDGVRGDELPEELRRREGRRQKSAEARELLAREAEAAAAEAEAAARTDPETAAGAEPEPPAAAEPDAARAMKAPEPPAEPADPATADRAV